MRWVLVSSVFAAAAACQAAPQGRLADDRGVEGRTMTSAADSPAERFGSLDAYLDWLKAHNGPRDRGWYERIGPDLYEFRTGGNLKLDTAPERRVYTRAQLMAKFGFAR